MIYPAALDSLESILASVATLRRLGASRLEDVEQDLAEVDETLGSLIDELT